MIAGKMSGNCDRWSDGFTSGAGSVWPVRGDLDDWPRLRPESCMRIIFFSNVSKKDEWE
jgi:hypothetical protein